MKKISGVGKRHILKNFFKRINTPYDLRIRNAIDGEEMLHLALTKKSVYILISTFLVISFFLVSLIFLFTPIKYYIPGYETNASRNKILQLRVQIDSMARYQENYDKIINNVLAVASDNENVLLDTMSLNKRQLSSADAANEMAIETDIGKQKTIGKMPTDTILNNKGKTAKIAEIQEVNVREVAPVKKKRDTIIIYQ